MGFFTDNIDHPVYGIGPPEGGAWASDHLDAVHILQHQVIDLPVHPGEHGGINAPAIDQHQQLGGKPAVEPPGIHRPFVGVDPGHIHPGNHAQGIGDIGHPGPFQILIGDHKNGGGAVGKGLAFLADRGDLDRHQLFNTHPGQIHLTG